MNSEEESKPEEPDMDHQLKEFTCSSCGDRCEAAMLVTVPDGGQVDG